MITEKEFLKIFENTASELSKIEGNNCYLGMQIIAKYTKNIVAGANHDIIFSESMEKLIEAGITKKDTTELSRLNWHIEDEEDLCCFV